MFREEILANEYRRQLYQYLKKNPGLHLRELQRRLDIPLSTLDYHLNYMAQKHILEYRRNGYYTRYYVTPFEKTDQKLLSILRQKRLREILILILYEKKVKYQTLLQRLKIPSSTLSFYLDQLMKANVIQRHHIGREHMYTVTNEDVLMKLLITYQSSFVDRLIDNVISTWMEIRRPIKDREEES